MTQSKSKKTKEEETMSAPTPPPIRPTSVKGTRKAVTDTVPKTPVSKTKRTVARTPHKSTPNNRTRTPRKKGGNNNRRSRPGLLFGPSRSKQDSTSIKQPPRNPDAMHVIPLGGLEEIGRNSAAVEYKNDIVIIDLGLMFPSENMHGIDYIIPDISPLYGKEKNIKGVFITHAHLDHFGAVPHLIPKLGNPPIFGSEFTMRLVEKRQSDFPQFAKPKVNFVKPNQKLKLGKLEIETFHVNHSIPNAFGADEDHIKKIGKEGVTVLYSDSTGAEREGHSLSESTIETNLDSLFDRHPKQRIIVATFSSMIDRLQQLISVAEKHGRKVAIDGYSMKTNVEIAKEIGYIKCDQKTLITAEQSNKLPPDKVLILCTGAQGEDNAALVRIVNKEHRSLELQAGDVMIFSSSVIPGNEASVQQVKDQIYKQGAEVYHYKMMDVHSGGHGHRDDLQHMVDLMQPEFLVPAHGYFSFRAEHAKMAVKNGLNRNNILLPSNGEVVSIADNKAKLSGEKYDIKYIMVDGLGVGDIGNVVLRDRQALASDGMVVVIAIIDGHSGKVIGEPDLISRGFVYMKEQRQLIHDTRKKIKEVIQKQHGQQNGGEPNWSHLKANLRDSIGAFLFQKTERRPMILPVIVEV
jgi:ribonuclease J